MISRRHFSQSDLFDTSKWSSIWDMTLTLRQARKTDDGARWIKADEYQCRAAFRHFMRLLNRAVYGNAVCRYGKQLRVLPILEKEENQRWHFHAAIESPTHIEPNRFVASVRECWSKVDWGYHEIMIRPSANRGWIKYMLKCPQKSAFDAWSDCISWESLHNPSNC
jgi:hypothetical protein